MRRTLVTAFLAVAAVAAGSIAYAAIPSGNGVISACKAKDGGIKLVDREAGQGCPGSQQLVEWNQQGPAGPAGPASPAGSGDGYVEVTSNSSIPPGPVTTIATLSLPAGRYVLFAKGLIGINSDVGTQMSCGLYGPQEFDSQTFDLRGFRQIFSLVIPAEYSEDGVATLECSTGSATPVTLTGVTITAIEVGSLTLS